MIESKWVPWIAGVLIAVLTVGIFALAWNWSPQQNDRVEAEYVSKLFLNDIITIDITVDEEEWQGMLDNATAEEFIPCDITIDGTTFYTVGIRPKGNSSLTQVAGSDSDRFSFRLSFDEYIDGQTCFGLDQMVLNNSHSDNTMMKDFICYDLMRYMGVDAPLTTYANVLVNGEQWGVYLAVELYNDSFMERVYGTTSGKLYNVKMSMGMGGDKGGALPEMDEEAMQRFREARENGEMPQMPDGEGFQPPQGGMVPPDMTQDQNAAQDQNAEPDQSAAQDQNAAPQAGGDIQGAPGGMQGGRGMGGGMPGSRGGGGDLVYNGDDAEQYSSIFDNVVGKSDASAESRMIEAIEHLNTGEDLEEYWDVDKALRYLAVHTFVVNLDSYSSNMQQNYYLYEEDGKVTVLPWDYNLAFGGFMGGNASSSVNFPIDTPVSGAEMEDRPLINTLLSNEEYLERYHSYLQEICEKYVNSGLLETTIAQVRDAVDAYVATDPTKFCTTEEYENATEALITFCKLRAESVMGQLDGSIPSTTEGQAADSSALVAVDNSLIQEMGSQGGGGRGGMDRNRQDPNSTVTEQSGTGSESAEAQNSTTDKMPAPGDAGAPAAPPDDATQSSGSTRPGRMQNQQISDGQTVPGQRDQARSNGESGAASGQSEQDTAGNLPDPSSENAEQGQEQTVPEQAEENADRQFPDRGGFPGMGSSANTFEIQDWIPTIAGVVLLLIALTIAVKWKRKY